MSLLIVSAITSELDTLRAFLSKSQEEAGLISGNLSGHSVTLAAIGIGSVEAAITLSQILGAHPFDKVYFVGTGGILPGHKLEINQAVEVSWVQPAQAPGERLVGSLFDNIECDLRPPEEGVHVWCSQGVSESQELARHAASFAAQVENLELWGVARACKRFETPFGAVLGLSNLVGEQAGEQWQANRESAAMAACHKMADIIKAS